MKPNFVIAVTGQSNSQGIGGNYEFHKTEDQSHERVLSFNGEQWVIANLLDQSLGSTDHKPLGSQLFAFHFAKQIAKNDPSKIVGIVNFGIGGQEIKRWTKIPAESMFHFIPNKWNVDSLCIKGCNDRLLCMDSNFKVHFSRPVYINYGWESFCIEDSNNNVIQVNEMSNNTKVYLKNLYWNKYISGQTLHDTSNDECAWTLIITKIGNRNYYSFKKDNVYLSLSDTHYVYGDTLGVDINSCSLVTKDSLEFGDIYYTHVEKITDSMKSANLKKIDCICMHQGESDFNNHGTYYENALYQIISNYRKEWFCEFDTPFIVGNTCQVLHDNSDFWNQRNKQLYKLNIDDLQNTACVETVGVEYNFNDTIHFSSEGHRQLGYLYCNKFLEMKF